MALIKMVTMDVIIHLIGAKTSKQYINVLKNSHKKRLIL